MFEIINLMPAIDILIAGIMFVLILIWRKK